MRPQHIAEFISDLISDHCETCNKDFEVDHPDHVPHILAGGAGADVAVNSWTDDGEILLALTNDAGSFDIRITRRA